MNGEIEAKIIIKAINLLIIFNKQYINEKRFKQKANFRFK